MNYLITVEEGGPVECLAHYGVKGMKWGVWNTETKARYSGSSNQDHEKAVQTAGLSAAANLAKFSRGALVINPAIAAVAFGSAYATSRAGSAAIRAGKSAIEKKITDPVKREKAQRKLEDRVNALSYATTSGAVTLAGTGNPLAAGIVFGTSYTSSRIAQSAVKAGKPAIDKLVKNPAKRETAYKVTEIGLRAATDAGLRKAGANAVNALVWTLYDNATTPHAHSLPGNFFGVNAKPHGSATQPTNGISSQLSSANIPDSLGSNPWVYRKRV